MSTTTTRTTKPAASAADDAKATVSVEYAKSGRSACKEEDREEIRELDKKRKSNQTAIGPTEESSPKKVKANLPSSGEGVAENATISIEYAKSGRSTCKVCSEGIAKGELRLGATARDPRGYDSTKWYHITCFPTSSHPLGPIKDIVGFDSIKEADREEVRELDKKHKRDQTAMGPTEESSPKKVKANLPSSGEGVAENATISIEYAKSGRSTCKVCSVSIAKGALRLGATARDPRGYDSTKWYHAACFPTSSHPLDPVEEVKGFDSIKEEDREEVRALNKKHKRDQTGPTEESSTKKVKATLSSPAAGVAENASISVEYAKSGRSTCKGCSEIIASGALRLGATIRDPRGFDSTKWYHMTCFPASTYPAFTVENLMGFDSIKNQDCDKLREFEESHNRDGNVTGQLNEPSLKKEAVHSMEDSNGVENNLEGVKMLAGDKRAGPDATLPAHWKAFNTVIFREQDDGLQPSTKIAAFDFDGCLAKTSVRIVGADKWSLQYESIPEKLQILYNDGYKLVIFTNESNIERWKNKRQQAVDSKIGRLDKFIDRVKVFIACGLGKGKNIPDDPFRKPNTGMWWLMTEHFNSGLAVDMDKSFYVGDAAGRETDHSDADKEFAKAIGLKFHVPEDYFAEAANI
uniref:PARP-type domain-containing protein n=1 Tax=Leersia perrieri TaxID=77586 RepID=A0A0D9V5D8_9ORYZ